MQRDFSRDAAKLVKRRCETTKQTMHIYIRDDIEQIDEEQTMRLVNTLPDWRRTLAMRYKFVAGKRECALAFHLLCLVLREQYGISKTPHFVIGEHGKPALLEYPSIHFNLSHCKKAVICVVDDKPIGVDIERIRSVNESLINYTMCKEEKEQIYAAESPAIAFTRFWTAKEAFYKFSGMGIQDNLKDSLSLAKQEGICIKTVEAIEKEYVYSIANRE